jgi:hypothetical protein
MKDMISGLLNKLENDGKWDGPDPMTPFRSCNWLLDSIM